MNAINSKLAKLNHSSIFYLCISFPLNISSIKFLYKHKEIILIFSFIFFHPLRKLAYTLSRSFFHLIQKFNYPIIITHFPHIINKK